jgi:competence protein ComEA
MVNPRHEARGLGYRVRYLPHETISDYNACYNVIYGGKIVKPAAADKLGIPLNEIWISEKWRKYEKYILHHELTEIKYRALGYGMDEAHTLAEMDCIAIWNKDPLWREMIVELHISDTENMARHIERSKG